MSEGNENIQPIQRGEPNVQQPAEPLSDHSSSVPSNSHSEQSLDIGDNQNQEKEADNSKTNKQDYLARKIRYKYCCKVCKHTDSSKKACVCVVPMNQRRTEIGGHGCQTCGCNGCSKEDFISRGEDPEYKPGEKQKKHKKQKEIADFQARNGCCRKCMKAFSKSNKSCLCQVPEDVRNTKLPSTGCKICGCFGCNPEDKKDPKNRKAVSKKERSRSRQKRGKHNRGLRSESSNSREYIDSTAMNFYNVEKSVIGGMIVNEYRIDPSLLGFGIPQRTHSYIIGRPK